MQRDHASKDLDGPFTAARPAKDRQSRVEDGSHSSFMKKEASNVQVFAEVVVDGLDGCEGDRGAADHFASASASNPYFARPPLLPRHPSVPL